MLRNDLIKALEKAIKPKEEQRERTKKTLIIIFLIILFLLFAPFAIAFGLLKNYEK